jgi:hypothetical protein
VTDQTQSLTRDTDGLREELSKEEKENMRQNWEKEAGRAAHGEKKKSRDVESKYRSEEKFRRRYVDDCDSEEEYRLRSTSPSRHKLEEEMGMRKEAVQRARITEKISNRQKMEEAIRVQEEAARRVAKAEATSADTASIPFSSSLPRAHNFQAGERRTSSGSHLRKTVDEDSCEDSDNNSSVQGSYHRYSSNPPRSSRKADPYITETPSPPPTTISTDHPRYLPTRSKTKGSPLPDRSERSSSRDGRRREKRTRTDKKASSSDR